MKMIFGMFVIVTIFALASATNKGDDTLMSEMKDLLRDETKQLRGENTKLQQENGALRRRIEQLQEQNVKMRDEKFQDENAQLKKEIQKIRHADRRQREKIEKKRKETKSKDSTRQDDAVLESKSNNFLKQQSYDGYDGYKYNAKAIAEVVFTNGSAHATSSLGSDYSPANAFVAGNSKDFWHSHSGVNYSGRFPKMIWYDFSIGNGFVPARITFQGSQRSKSYIPYTPSIWEFVGSNDEVCSKSSDWTILCRDYSDVQPRDVYVIKRCDVEGRAQKKFRCLGINILYNRYAYSAVSNIRMWRKA